ncbi:MAG: leucine-rich repeat domain-containing protein [Bacteroidetes bacterium]|nr:MAG: leucine-rich repeat domain-containing protein [Bacteroidota bacterium]
MTLTDFARQVPSFFALKLSSMYGSGQITFAEYCLRENQYNESAFVATKITDFRHIWEEVLNMTDLQALILDIETLQKPAMSNFFENLGRLKKLRFLYIANRQVYYEDELREVVIPDLPALETLFVQAKTEVTLKMPLPALQYLTIRGGIINITQTLAKLNPETLTSLALRSCAKGYKTEFAVGEIGKFSKLTYLNLSDNKIKKLQFSLQDLPNLEHLDLSENASFLLTEDFIFLDNLYRLGISATKTVSQKYLKTGNDFLQIVKDCKEKNATVEQRKAIFQLLHNPQTLHNISLQAWFELYEIVTLLPLHQQLLAVLEKLVTVSVGELYKQASLVEICVAGRLQGITAQFLKDKLKQYNIKQNNKLTAKTSLVCIGERADVEIVRQVVAQNLPFCTPFHLKRFLEELDTPYLVEAESDVYENLENLLQSPEVENRVLALQLMKSGGIPPHILPYLCIELFYETAICKNEILALLRNFVSNEQYLFLQNTYKKQQGEIKVTTIRQLLSGEMFEKRAVAEAITRFYRLTRKETYNDYHDKRIFYAKFVLRIWKQADLEDIVWKAHFDEATGTLDLLWYRDSLRDIPKSFFGKPEVKRVLFMGFHLPDIPYIQKWTNIEEYVVYGTGFVLSTAHSAPAKKNFPTTIKLTTVLLKDVDIY